MKENKTHSNWYNNVNMYDEWQANPNSVPLSSQAVLLLSHHYFTVFNNNWMHTQVMMECVCVCVGGGGGTCFHGLAKRL